MLGDHIRALKGGKWLHGIDLGDQRVLHLAEQPGLAPSDRLRRVYKPDFTAGATAVELVVHRERAYPPRAVVARAWSRYMDPSVIAMFRDSEQFAAWCKIGRVPESAPASAPPAKAAAGAVAPARKAAPKVKPAAKAKAKAKVKAKAKARPAAPKAAPKRKAPAKTAARKAVARKPAPKASAARRKPAAKKPTRKKGRR